MQRDKRFDLTPAEALKAIRAILNHVASQQTKKVMATDDYKILMAMTMADTYYDFDIAS